MAGPWQILGLDGPASDGEIRRAYARQLKRLDLEQDAQRFQVLVEARRQALQIACRHRARSFDVREAVPEETTVAKIPSASNSEVGESRDGVDEWTAEDGEPRTGATREAGPNVLVPLRSMPNQDPTVETPSVELIEQRLKLISADGWKSDLAPQWSALLRDMHDLPLGQVRRLEPLAIAAVASLTLNAELLAPLPWWKYWPRINRFCRPSRYTDRGYLQTVLGLASFYGWLASDRAVHNHLRHSDAVEIGVHLHAVRNAYLALDGKGPASDPGQGHEKPLERDFVAVFVEYTSSDDEAATKPAATLRLGLYSTYLRTGRWPMTWGWSIFWIAPLWAYFNHNKLLSGLWVILCVYLPIKSTDLSYPSKRAFIVLLLSLALCLHAWIAAYGFRGGIVRALRLIAKADRRHIFHPDLRRTYLAGANPDEFGRPKPRRSVWGPRLIGLVTFVYLLCAAKFSLHVIGLFVE